MKKPLDKLLDKMPVIIPALDSKFTRPWVDSWLRNEGFEITAKEVPPVWWGNKWLNVLMIVLAILAVAIYNTHAAFSTAVSVAFVLFIVFIIALKQRYAWNRTSRAAHTLYRWILDNQQFKMATRSLGRDKSGREQTEEYVSDSIHFNVRKDDTFLYVFAYDHNDQYRKAIMALDDDLPSLFELPLERVDKSFKGYTYVLRLRPVERVRYAQGYFKNLPSFAGRAKYQIPLNSEIVYDYAKHPHVLVAGTTGSGKTWSYFTFILGFLARNCDCYICDPKQSDLSMLRFVLGEGKVASTPGTIARNCRRVLEIMQERYEQMAKPENFGKDFADLGWDAVVLVFDEMGAFSAIADRKTAQEVEDALRAIILQGRQCGVLACLCAQQPNASVVSTDIRDNLSLRLLCGNGNAFLKQILFGEAVELDEVRVKGGGYLFLDGLGWDKPRYLEMPTYPLDFDFMQAFKDVSMQNTHYAEFWAKQNQAEAASSDAVEPESESPDAEPPSEIVVEPVLVESDGQQA